MIKKSILAICLVIISISLVGCFDREWFSKSSYFNGTVIVEYQQYSNRANNDYLTFRFYEKGTYEISFSITPKKQGGKGSKYLPQNFTKTINAMPREFIIEQFILPDFLRITIRKDGKSEFHDFS